MASIFRQRASETYVCWDVIFLLFHHSHFLWRFTFSERPEKRFGLPLNGTHWVQPSQI